MYLELEAVKKNQVRKDCYDITMIINLPGHAIASSFTNNASCFPNQTFAYVSPQSLLLLLIMIFVRFPAKILQGRWIFHLRMITLPMTNIEAAVDPLRLINMPLHNADDATGSHMTSDASWELWCHRAGFNCDHCALSVLPL